MNHKDTIFQLLATGHRIAAAAKTDKNPRRNEHLARQAVGYFNAAAVLLNAFSDLHNELIEHPQFVAARKFARQYRF